MLLDGVFRWNWMESGRQKIKNIVWRTFQKKIN